MLDQRECHVPIQGTLGQSNTPGHLSKGEALGRIMPLRDFLLLVEAPIISTMAYEVGSAVSVSGSGSELRIYYSLLLYLSDSRLAVFMTK